MTVSLSTNFHRIKAALIVVLAASTVCITVAAPADAVSTGVCWAWNMDNKVTGNFLTDGSHNGATADAHTYTLTDFKVNSSIYTTVEVGSISDGTYAFGSQSPYSFVWNGTAPTIFQRASYSDLGWNRNGFGIFNDSSDGSGAYIGFGIASSYIADDAYGTFRYSSSNGISLIPTSRSSCDPAPVNPLPVYEPQAVQFLTTLTPPKIQFSDGNLLCIAGEYRSGYIIDGVIQGNAAIKYKPGTYVFNLLIDGVLQTSLTKTISGFNGAGWDQESNAPSGSIASCSVTVTVNHLTNVDQSTDKSDENSSLLSAAKATLAKSILDADAEYELASSQNARDLEENLGSVRLIRSYGIWPIQMSYDYKNQSLEREYRANRMDYRAYAAARAVLRKQEADEIRNFPALLDSFAEMFTAMKNNANKAALDAKISAIAKANATYGTFIESIGYGVLIP